MTDDRIYEVLIMFEVKKSSKDDFQSIREKVDKNIIKKSLSDCEIINKSIKEMVIAGGKRIRPLLVILVSRFGNPDQNKILNIATGLELLHMATLIHDDIIDEARYRRGKKTIQKKYDKKLALLIGDFLLNRSYSILTGNLSTKSLIRLNKVEKRICEGEIKQYQNQYKYNLSIIDYLKRIKLKTASLFGFCTLTGAYESQISNSFLNIFHELGLNLGIAFQIRDDILDLKEGKNKTGKKGNKDLREGIPTLPILFLLNDLKYSRETKKVLNKKNIEPADIKRIKMMLKKSKSFDKSLNLASYYFNKSSYYLNLLPDNKYKKDLIKLKNSISINNI